MTEEISDKIRDDIIKFLSIYKKGDLLFVSCLKRKFPYMTDNAISILLGSLEDKGFIKKVPSYSCPACGHKCYGQSRINQIQEYEELCCEHCDEATPYDKRYLGFEYKIVMPVPKETAKQKI